jgi:hypothetical protein
MNWTCRYHNVPAPSIRHTIGFFPSLFRRVTCSANHEKVRSLPFSSVLLIVRVSSARTSSCRGRARFSLRAFLAISSITSDTVRTNGAIVYTTPTHASRFPLLAPLTFGDFDASSPRIGTPLPSAVSTWIVPSSCASGHGLHSRNASTRAAAPDIICSRRRTERIASTGAISCLCVSLVPYTVRGIVSSPTIDT